MPSEGAGWSPWVVFGFNPSDGEAVRVSAAGGYESYSKEMKRKKDSHADGDESGGDTYTADNNGDATNVSAAMSDELIKAKMVTAEMEVEVKDLRDQVEMMKEEMVKVNESHNEQLKADETQYSKEFTTQADLVYELQKTNNELLWSNRELQDRIKLMMDGDEFEIFTEKLQESNAIIVALREENERVSKIVEDIQDAATLETCGTSSTRPSEIDIVQVVKSMATEVVSVSRESEKLGLCPSFAFQSSSESGSSNNTKSISECIVELGRLMADARSSETVLREENSSLRDELLTAQKAVDSLQNEHNNAVCELRKVTETLEWSRQETTQAQMALLDSEISHQTAAAYKEELDDQLSAARAELEATRVTIDSYGSQLKMMEGNRATTELELSAATAEVESYRESMNLYVSELNMLEGVQATAEGVHTAHQQTLEEFGDLKNRYSAVMAEAVEYRLQADSIEAELRRQIVVTEAVSEEKWGTAYKELERKMQNQKDEDNVRFTNLIEEKELQLSELQQQMGKYNLQFTDLLQSKEEDRLQLSELLQQKEEGYTELTELLRQKEENNVRFANLIDEKELQLSELQQQMGKYNLQFTDLLQSKEEDRLQLSELLQQKEEGYTELTELLSQKDESLRHLEHLDKDNQRFSNLLHEKENERLRLSELLQQKEEDYVQMSEMFAKAQDNESEKFSELQCYSREMEMRLKECDCQLVLSRQETIKAEQNSIKSYEQWTSAYEDIQSALVTAEEREQTVMHEMQAKLAQYALDLDTAKGKVLDLEEQLRIITDDSARMRSEQEEILHLSKAKENDYFARIEELTSEQSMHLEQLEAHERECSLLSEKNARLEIDLLNEVGVEEKHQVATKHPLCDDTETELKKQIETLSAGLENAQAAAQQHILPLNHLARLAGNDSALRERDKEIEKLKKALEKARLVIPNGSADSFQVLDSTDSQAETCGDQANEFKRGNAALRSQISSMELQIDSLGIQVDIQTKNMEDMLVTHFEQKRLLELEIEQLKESSRAAAHNDNFEGVGDDHFSFMASIKATEELSEIMSRASHLQHKAKKLGKELNEAREESEARQTVIYRILQLIGHDPDAADADVCSAVYAKCLEISELQERVQVNEKLMMELCELLDCCEDTLIRRAMELGSMYSGIQSNKNAITYSNKSNEGVDLQCPNADAAMVARSLTDDERGGCGDVESPAPPFNELVKALSRHQSTYSSPWEDWEHEDSKVDEEVYDSKDHSDMVVPHDKGAVAIDGEGGRLDYFNSSDILSRICDVIAVTSHDEALTYVTQMNEMLFAVASTLDIPLNQEECSVAPCLHLINEAVPAIHTRMSIISNALKNCGFEEKGEPIDAHFWQWSIDCIDSLRQQRDHMTELERGADAFAESGPLLDVLKTAATELNCDDIDVPFKVQELIKLNAELYEMKEKFLEEEQDPLKKESPVAGCDDIKTENFPCDNDAAKMRDEEVESWQQQYDSQLSQSHRHRIHSETGELQQRDESQMLAAVMASEEQVVEDHHVLPVQKSSEGEELTVMDEGKNADGIIVSLMETLSCTEPSMLSLAVEALQKEHVEVEASSKRLWQTALQALHVVCVALTDAALDKGPDSMLLQHRIEEAISASSWHGGRAADESLSLLNAAAKELGNKAMNLNEISISIASPPAPLVQEDIITTRDLDSSSKILYRVLQHWGNFYLCTRLNSVREACQQEIAAARKEAEDWVMSHFNFDNLPCLELKGLQLALPEEEQLPSMQLDCQIYEENWNKVNCSIKNVAYEVHRAWNDSSAFVSSQPCGNVAPDVPVIMELESSLKRVQRECEDRCQDLECARSSVSNLQEENHKLYQDLDVMHERLQTMCSSQQTADLDSGDVFRDEKLESPYGIKSVEPKVLDTSISKPQPQPTAVDHVSKDIHVIQKEVGGTKTVHRFWRKAAIDFLLLSIYLTVISFGYD